MRRYVQGSHVSITQDTDYAVRICMCWQLAALARALGREATAEKLLPEALEVLHPSWLMRGARK